MANSPKEGNKRGGGSRPPAQFHSAARFIIVFCAARQTTCGVAGIATSSWPSASVIALMTAGGQAVAPASPQPLIPSGFEGQTVSIVSILNEGRLSARGMQ